MLPVLPLTFQFGQSFTLISNGEKILDTLLKHTFSILITKKNHSFMAPLWFLHEFTKHAVLQVRVRSVKGIHKRNKT